VDGISVVINTFNEEKNLPRALASIKDLADEVIVCDMESSDTTVAIAEAAGARVYTHKRAGYVEPARNFAISKATRAWVLLLDADEEIPIKLAEKLKELSDKPTADYYRISRKNIIFGNWIKHTRFWPDYNIRFFKKGYVLWNEVIHSVPITKGKGVDLADKENTAILHYNYNSIDQYLDRMNRYTDIQAKLLIRSKHKFLWKDLIEKPTAEFVSRYFAGEGYKDGLHGLAISLLQAFSETILYMKVWQEEKFLEQSISSEEITMELTKTKKELDWWLTDIAIKSKDTFSSFFLRLLRKLKNKNV